MVFVGGLSKGNLFVIIDSISRVIICTVSNSWNDCTTKFFIGALNALKAQLLESMERRQWRWYRPTVENRFFGRLAYYIQAQWHTKILFIYRAFLFFFFFFPFSFSRIFRSRLYISFLFLRTERHFFPFMRPWSPIFLASRKKMFQINRGVDKRGDKLIVHTAMKPILYSGFDRNEGAPDTYHHGKKRRSSERNLWPGRKVYGGNGLLQDGYRSSDYTGSKKRGMEFRERFVNCDKRVRLSLHLNRRWGGGTVRFFSNFFSLSLPLLNSTNSLLFLFVRLN